MFPPHNLVLALQYLGSARTNAYMQVRASRVTLKLDMSSQNCIARVIVPLRERVVAGYQSEHFSSNDEHIINRLVEVGSGFVEFEFIFTHRHCIAEPKKRNGRRGDIKYYSTEPERAPNKKEGQRKRVRASCGMRYVNRDREGMRKRICEARGANAKRTGVVASW